MVPKDKKKLYLTYKVCIHELKNLPVDGAEPKVNPVLPPASLLPLLPKPGNPDPALLFPVPKLKPEGAVEEFVESSDLEPKVNPVEGVFSAALPKVNPVVVLVVVSDDPDPKNPEAENKEDISSKHLKVR